MNKSLQHIATMITSHEIWIVGATVFLSMVKTSLLPWSVLIALLFWPIRWIANGRLSQRTPIDLGIVLLILTIPVTFWATALPEKTIPQIYRLALGILFFYSLVNWTRNYQKLGLLVSGLILAGVGLTWIAIFSVNWITTKLQFIPASIYQQFELLASDTIHPNVMAGNIVIILPIGIALLLFVWKKLKVWQTILLLAAIFFTSGMVILTQSRGALLGLGVALLVIIMLRWRLGWLAIPLAGLGAALTIYQIGLDTVLDFIASGISVEGVEGRIEIWSRAIFMLQDFAITGIGMGSFTEVADKLYPFFLAEPGKIAHAHNIYLQIAVDLGIPGLIAWLSIFLGVCLVAWKLYRLGKQNSDNWATALGAGFLGSQLALVTHGLMDAVTWGMVKPAPLLWGIWGIALAAWNILVVENRRQKRASIQNNSL